MTIDERIFWWLVVALFTWFIAFPAHAAFSGYGIDEVTPGNELLQTPTPEAQVIAFYTVNRCGADICATLYPTQLAAQENAGLGPRIYTARDLIGFIESLENAGLDASISRRALADLVKTKIILRK